MAKDFGCKYSILGHSERRNVFGETDELVGKKVKACLKAEISPVLCIGEHLEERKAGSYTQILQTQLQKALMGVSNQEAEHLSIAYEPVWAIGKGALPATPEEFREMNIFIKKILSDKFGVKEASKVKIIYGGSVDDKNALDFIKDGQADGFLPGRASLDAEKFSKIIKICEASSK